MFLNGKLIHGVVQPFQLIDQFLKNQGFVRCHNHPPIYNLHVKDSSTNSTYRLFIPTSIPTNNNQSIRLERPILTASSPQTLIPKSMIQALNEKIEEIASYLRVNK